MECRKEIKNSLSYRFIHTADLHIGKNQNRQGARYEDFISSLAQIVDIAFLKKADSILCAGDFFDLKAVSPKTLEKTTAILMKLKNIDFIAIEGNHDRASFKDIDSSWLRYLSSVGLITLLKQDYSENNELILDNAVYENEKVKITGLSYMGSATADYLKVLAQTEIKPLNKASVLMLHAGLSEVLPQDLAKISKQDLEPLNEIYDYIALGHIHKTYNYGKAYNPGSGEFVDMGEAKRKDIKGVYLVEIDDEKLLNVQFINLHTRKHHFVSIEAKSSKDISNIITQQLSATGEDFRNSILEITIYLSSNEFLDIAMLEQIVLEYTGAYLVFIAYFGALNSMFFSANEHTDMEELEKKVIAEVIESLGYSQNNSEMLKDIALKILDFNLSPQEYIDISILAGKKIKTEE